MKDEPYMSIRIRIIAILIPMFSATSLTYVTPMLSHLLKAVTMIKMMDLDIHPVEGKFDSGHYSSNQVWCLN